MWKSLRLFKVSLSVGMASERARLELERFVRCEDWIVGIHEFKVGIQRSQSQKKPKDSKAKTFSLIDPYHLLIFPLIIPHSLSTL